jgi:hypothetical protein
MTKRTRYPNETEEDYAKYEENYKAKRRAYRDRERQQRVLFEFDPQTLTVTLYA